MRKTGAHRFSGYVSAISGGLCALLVTGLAAAGVQTELPAESDDGWSLRKEAGNIRVYTIDHQDSSFKAFKAVAMLDAPIETVMAVMMNPKSCVEWVHNCTESYAFGTGSFHDRYAYSVNDMPWPVTDRDYVLHIRTRGNRDSSEIVMDLSATPNQRAEFDNRVRVDRSDTLYRFIPEGDKTRMIWLQHTDPNGALPGWLVNSLLVDIPVRSLKALEQVAGKDRYQDFELVYDDQDRLVDVRPTEH
ncbi:START domain-containing protein [Marinobacter similis]|uniref:Lipid-binding START domain-containing protein n=1 Tax=Marinobacter similis TaxID=1420916 RepID=W5YIR2_9GAMM|nr:START domain-containing protein [Marinobacter similis]AHI28749.1 lipid-binding START domain-containing protein [Marinobacter similis]